MAQWFSVRKGQLFRSSFTGASRSTGRWLTCPMDARQKARATVWGGRRSRPAIRQRSKPDSTMSSRPRQQPPQPAQANENASSRASSGVVRAKSTRPQRSSCESLSM